MTFSWTQPTCERCWIDRNIKREEDSFSIPMPVSVKDPGLEQCSFCGLLTIVGIYTRADPSTVAYPKEKE